MICPVAGVGLSDLRYFRGKLLALSIKLPNVQIKFTQLDNYLQNTGQLESQNTRDKDASEILGAFRRSQVMQAYAICHGVTAKTTLTNNDALGRLEGHARLASYQFHPVSEKSGKVSQAPMYNWGRLLEMMLTIKLGLKPNLVMRPLSSFETIEHLF